MAQTKHTSGPQPKRPSPMMVQPRMTLGRAIELMTPRWMKRIRRRKGARSHD